MLTVLRYFRPRMKEAYYAVLVDGCLAKAEYYSQIDTAKSAYWTKMACKYLLKRLKAVQEL